MSESSLDEYQLPHLMENTVRRRTKGLTTKSLCDKILKVCELVSGCTLYPYQVEFAKRIIEAVLEREAEELSAIVARQGGKSQVLSAVSAALMFTLPMLSSIYPEDDRFCFLDPKSGVVRGYDKGFWIAVFAPKKEQASIIFKRVRAFFRSDAVLLLAEELGVTFTSNNGDTIALSNGSFIKCSTASDQSSIEGLTLHLGIMDESQDISDEKASKSIGPMMAASAGTIVKIGSANARKSHFLMTCRRNERRHRQGSKKCHFFADWREVSKYNSDYERFVMKEMIRLGERSDEFQMSYCTVPSTRILTSDLRHIPAGEVKVGMSLMGFDEDRPSKGQHRKYKKAIVERVARLRLPCVEIVLDDGSKVTCSTDHQWLVFTAGGRAVWKKSINLTSNDRIVRLTDTWDQDTSYEAAYLAAAFDGEGCLATNPKKQVTSLTFSQKRNAMLSTVESFLEKLGVSTWDSYRQVPDKDIYILGIGEGTASIMRFLGSIRPRRLLEKVEECPWGSLSRHDNRTDGFKHPHVRSVTKVGVKEVVAIKTSSSTYIAEGLASHNCGKFMLARGMAFTDQVFESCCVIDPRYLPYNDVMPMRRMGKHYAAGIDFGKVHDSTVVTIVEVDWDSPRQVLEGSTPEDGYFVVEIFGKHVCTWLEMQGDDYESQFHIIKKFITPWCVERIALDYTGVGQGLGDRFKAHYDGVDVEFCTFTDHMKDQLGRQLLSDVAGGFLTWPGGPDVRELREWREFRGQMLDLEKEYKAKSGLLSLHHPDIRGAKDDYPDSLSLAVHAALTRPFGGEAEEEDNVY